jgi:PAS domain S-box-containing protein
MAIDQQYLNFFAQQVQAAHQRIQTLYQALQTTHQQQPELTISSLEELQLGLEELSVAEEELRQQNEELMVMQQMLEVERQRYFELFECAPDGYLITDAYGTIQEANQKAGLLLNIAPKHLIGKPLVSFVLEADRRGFRSILHQLPKINRIQEWEVALCPRDRSCFQGSITVETVGHTTEQASTLRWLLRDITTRKQTEEKLYQVQLNNLELKELDRLKDQFIAIISHELHVPLTAILGFSQLLQQSYIWHDAQAMSMVDRIVRNSKHLLTIVEELISFSQLGSHRLELRLESFDLIEFIITITDELRSLFEQKNLELRFYFSTPTLSIINDPNRLRQILVNLLSNAIKFTNIGSITLEIRELPADQIEIAVIDTGIGIAPADQAKIFDEFWQATPASSHSSEGMGLGLAIAKAIVEVMQGQITVESHLGEGSSFYVKLPRWVEYKADSSPEKDSDTVNK